MPEEIIIPDEPQFKLKYAILTPDAYINLNNQIGEAKGYTAEKSTQRYAPVEPQMSAPVLDEEENVITPSLCVMPITAEVQEHYPQLLEDVELVDSYTPLVTINA